MVTKTPGAKREVAWQPNPGAQTAFLASRADEQLYGGAAGGGKSFALLMKFAGCIHLANFRGLYLRREGKYLGDAIDKSRKIFLPLGGRLREHPRVEWVFPSGAKIWFSHCEHEKDVRNYDSFEFQKIAFDELTHFTFAQYIGISARLRTSDPSIPLEVISATNPGGDGHDWVFDRWAPWLDPAFGKSSKRGDPRHLRPAKAGECRWRLGTEWCEPFRPGSVSLTFIPAKLKDNPKIPKAYENTLNRLPLLRRMQLRDGIWIRREGKKLYWDRDVVSHADRIEQLGAPVFCRVRAWDFAATEDEDDTTNADYSASVRMALLTNGVVAIEHAHHAKRGPRRVRKLFSEVASKDPEGTFQLIPQDPGQAGLDQVESYRAEFPSVPIVGVRPQADKVARFSNLSARCDSGEVVVIRGEWNEDFHSELESFTEPGAHDDIVDAASDCFNRIVEIGRIGPRASGSSSPEPGRWEGVDGRGF